MKPMKLALEIVCLLWAIHLINVIFPGDLRLLGIRPRSIQGLPGIVCSPFLHSNLSHLCANSGALFVLLSVSFLYSMEMTLMALAYIVSIGGGMVWLLGAPGTLHIGASGVIFGLIGFLICSGYYHHNVKAVVISILVCFFMAVRYSHFSQ
ncbi:MAG: Peptidase, S54 (Rhomboid) family [Candidatus Magnetoglobus multicellularis str. Araruama]|uniref:Peptidase, S54 (Rhomboid) family n=1 Tax=Candidatus Magnetoglobus multicellularis str. Araruama TaxID=890399 RepID=A0A1V1PI75_9BACT|nr:MAG: Peptidase, S54 (Rhomboid) family [Candidatus Magnetoglobus multicellularis str. Araruama]